MQTRRAAYLKATEIELKPADGISVEFITYPDPLIRKFSFSETPLKVYEGETNLKVRLKADKKATEANTTFPPNCAYRHVTTRFVTRPARST
jgi:hypothetical protein